MKVIFNNTTLKFAKSNSTRYNITMGYDFANASQTTTGSIVNAAILSTSAVDRGVVVAPVKNGDNVVVKNATGFSTSANVFLIDTSWVVRGIYPITSNVEFTASCDGVVIVGSLSASNPYIDVFSATTCNIEVYYGYTTGKFINSSGRVTATSGTALLAPTIALDSGDVVSVATTALNGNVTAIGTTTDATVDYNTVYTTRVKPTGTDKTNSQYTATESCKVGSSSANIYIMAMVVRA